MIIPGKEIIRKKVTMSDEKKQKKIPRTHEFLVKLISMGSPWTTCCTDIYGGGGFFIEHNKYGKPTGMLFCECGNSISFRRFFRDREDKIPAMYRFAYKSGTKKKKPNLNKGNNWC